MNVELEAKRYERLQKKAVNAMKKGFTLKDGLKRAYMVLKNEDIDERDRISVFSFIVHTSLTPEGRRLILEEGHKEEVQEYFRKELGVAYSPRYLSINNGDGTMTDIKLMRYYLVDEPKPSCL